MFALQAHRGRQSIKRGVTLQKHHNRLRSDSSECFKKMASKKAPLNIRKVEKLASSDSKK